MVAHKDGSYPTYMVEPDGGRATQKVYLEGLNKFGTLMKLLKLPEENVKVDCMNEWLYDCTKHKCGVT